MIESFVGASTPVSVEAIDFELVWLGVDAQREPLGSFDDAHLQIAPRWRLVSGYLMLDSPEEGMLRASSHGHPAAELIPHSTRLDVDIPGSYTLLGQIVVADTGIGLVADPGTTWSRTSASGHLAASSIGPWGVTIVHGPAPVKIQARIRLLESLHRVGGRRA